MSVQIYINGENADEAIKELSALASHFIAAPAAAAAPAENKTRKSNKSETVEPEKQPETQPEPAESQETGKQDARKQGEVGQDVPDAQKPAGQAVSVEELRAKAAEVAKAGKQAEVKALLTKYEAKAVSTVPEDQRAAFLAELEAL